MTPRSRSLATGCLALTASLTPALAPAQDSLMLDEITVTAAPDVAAGTTTLTAADLATRFQGEGLASVLRGMAGVTTQGGAGDDAETAINVRGLQDHGRVAVTVDGMRQNFARSGHGANGSFAVDPEMLRDVTVTRGPGAASGAIGGAVALRSVSAEDLLQNGARTGTEIRLRHGDLSASPTLHAATAARLGDRFDVTFATTRAEKADYTAPDGTTVNAAQSSRSHLAVLGATLQNGQRLTFGVTYQDKDYVTGRSTGTPRANALTSDSVSLGYSADDVLGGWAVNAKLYDTGTRLQQQQLDATLLTPTGSRRSYDTQTTGLLVEGTRELDLGGHRHALSVRLEGFRDRVTTDDPAGSSLTPSGTRKIWSLMIEDQLALGAATLTFGLGANSYSTHSDAGSARGSALSPRIALDLPLGDRITLHAAAAMAYRPPTLSETLVDGTHPEPADFPIRPNPALAPERAQSAEIGLSYAGTDLLTSGDGLTLSATAFRNNIKDYIGLSWSGGIFNGYYQYDNIARVRIEGVELEAGYESHGYFIQLAGQHMRGTNLGTGAELSRVMPDRATVTLGHRSADNRREIGTRLTHSAAKIDGDFASDSWKTVDLYLRQDLSETASLGLSLNNILDEIYTPHLETQPSPGFNAQASLSLRF